jgi:hypothetical protein
MAATNKTVLEMVFESSKQNSSSVTITVNNPKLALTQTQVETAMQTIADKAIFNYLQAPKEAYYRKTEIEQVA